MKKTLLAICAGLILAGCSHKPEGVKTEKAVAVDSRVVQSDSEILVDESSSAPGSAAKSDGGEPAPKKPVALTTMYIKDGVSPEYQNGPSPEEVEKYRRLVEKKSAPRKTYYPEQTNDPVYDSEMMTLEQ